MNVNKRDLLEEIQLIDGYAIAPKDKKYFEGYKDCLNRIYTGEFNYDYLRNKKRMVRS